MNDAILSLLGSLFGTLCVIFTSSKLVNFRLKELEKKVEQFKNMIMEAVA